MNIPEVSGFVTNITIEENGFVPIDGEIFYSCATEGEVVNDTSLSLTGIFFFRKLFSIYLFDTHFTLSGQISHLVKQDI